MKIIYILCCAVFLISCSRIVSGKITDAKTGTPLSGVEVSSNSSDFKTFSDSSGNFRLILHEKHRKDHFYTASLQGYFDQDFFTEKKEIRLTPLVFIDSCVHWKPFYDLDSINGEPICKSPDSLAVHKHGLDSLLNLLRHEGLISEKVESIDSYGAFVCLIIDQFGKSVRMKVKVQLPMSVLLDSRQDSGSGHQPEMLLMEKHRLWAFESSEIEPNLKSAEQLIEEKVISVFSSSAWIPGTQNGRRVVSELSFSFCVP